MFICDDVWGWHAPFDYCKVIAILQLTTALDICVNKNATPAHTHSTPTHTYIHVHIISTCHHYAHTHTQSSKLVNKSVPNTVDLRALTKIPASASEDQKREANEENIVLALESARAIGCRVTDESGDNILNRHPQTIRDFLVDLIRVWRI